MGLCCVSGQGRAVGGVVFTTCVKVFTCMFFPPFCPQMAPKRVKGIEGASRLARPKPQVSGWEVAR
eukprot:3231001-Amphidinium_carterae.1